MIILINIGKIILNFIYLFIKLIPTKNRITIISRQSNKESIDISLIKKELNSQLLSYQIITLCKTLDKGFLKKLSYFFHMFKQMYYIGTSKVVILDSYCILVGILKHKKTLKVVQMWHALGAFKKFGKSIIDKDEAKVDMSITKNISSANLSKVMGMHKNYDYIFASSESSAVKFSEAFGQPVEKFKILPMARLDLMRERTNINRVKKEIYGKYPSLKTKKNILYCPTFRKDNSDYEKIKELIDSVDYKKYNLIVKLHPLTKYEFEKNNAIFDNKFNTYEMSFVADYVITDYSAVVYEIAFIGKPIYFYAYDKKDYVNNRDFYLNFDSDMPGPICYNIKELFERIGSSSIDKKKINDFRNNSIKDCNESYTKDIVNFIKSLL